MKIDILETIITENNMKNIIKSIILAICVYTLSIASPIVEVNAANTECKGLFPDMSQGELFCPYGEYLYHQNILSGDKNDGSKYRPSDNLTRGQLAKIIKTAFQIPTNVSGNDFPDVAKGNTFYTEIKSLRNAGIINGNSQGNYMPESPVSRDAMMKFILNASRYRSSNAIPESSFDLTKAFPDVPTTNTFYKEIRDVYAYSNNITDKDLKIINGYSDGKFNPSINVTRGQTAKILTNTIKALGIQTVECRESFCQDKFTGPIVAQANVYNDGKIKLEFPSSWTKSETLTRFLFAYEYNSGVQSVVGEKTSLNYILELDDRKCDALGTEIKNQLSKEDTFDDVNLKDTTLLKISEQNICKVSLQNTRDNIQVLQNIYILVLDLNQVYQIVTTSGSGVEVDENIVKTLKVL